jgi:hypothetical protein
MISLFGRKEFDPPASAMQDPRTALQLSGFWVLLSFVWLGLGIERNSHLRASGRPVGVWRESVVGFWVVILLFWLWNGWNSLRKYRAERKVV